MASKASGSPLNISDPDATFINASCLDLLLIEMVPMAHRLTAELDPSGQDETTDADDGAMGDTAFHRLEAWGYRVGQGLVERFSKDRSRFVDALDMIKFLCKDLWILVFRKQIDNLKTNHRGVFVLTDNSFKPFARMSTASSKEAVTRAQPYLWFPCGVIRGSLASMGISATVQAETSELPAATFQIKTAMTKN